MSNQQNEHDSYYIPPNFIEGGTLFGGMFKFRNVIEAGILAAAVGAPVFMFNLSLTVKIIILCLTALPVGLLALIGISGESLSSFIFGFFKFLKRRRIIGKVPEKAQKRKKQPKKQSEKRKHKEKHLKEEPSKEDKEKSMAAEILDVIRSRKASKKKKAAKPQKAAKVKKAKKQRPKKSAPESRFLNPVAEYLPVDKIENGIIYTKDHRYVKIIEVVPRQKAKVPCRE